MLAGVQILLAGCAAPTQSVYRSPSSVDAFGRDITSQLLDGKPAEARENLAAALRSQPQNGYLHLLNGLSYQLEDDSLQSLDLAKVGYDAAVKFAPGHFWSQYLDGSAALSHLNYVEAAEHFSRAIMVDPDRPEAFLGLAISAYYAGDLRVARVAADRALALAPADPLTLKTVAYVAAAQGDYARLNLALKNAEAIPTTARDPGIHKTRLAKLLRTAAIEQEMVTPEVNQTQNQPTPDASTTESVNLSQVMVEVTLLLSQNSNARNRGINLMDGLTLQFNLEHLTENRWATGTPETFSRAFTTALKVPQITYSLNLFNTRDDYYRVIARPSLVASVGQESSFFIGRTVTVGVSGINMGSLQPVDVGTSVKVTPTEITRDHAIFKVDVTRSFFAQESGGTFSQSLTTFKQTVTATVSVDFGKTLILSGLYEGVNVGGSSKTPVLGDIPVVDTLFNARTNTERRDTALVLVTPRIAGFLDTESREFRGDTLKKLLSLWKRLIDPSSNLDAIGDKLEGKFSRNFHTKAGDLKLPPVSDPETVRSVIKDTLAQLP
jgi:Flp pilus assembly protein TadD